MKRGFTLIELLVVIIILGVLSAFLVANFMGARERSRDSKRKSDLKQIQSALEMYRQDNPTSYPNALPNAGTCWSSAANCTANIYMKNVPGDPSTIPATNYYYELNATDTMKYTLCACLENKADNEGAAGGCDDLGMPCTSGIKFEVTEP